MFTLYFAIYSIAIMSFLFEVHTYLHYKKVLHEIGNLAKIYLKLFKKMHLFSSQNLKDLK